MSEADCNNTDVEGWNELECCEKPGLDIHENRCYKKYGGYGEKVVCDGTKEVVVSSCGSGSQGDCDGWCSSIVCCEYTIV